MNSLIQFSTRIEAPIERCFQLSLHTGLHVVSMQKHEEQAVAGIQNGIMHLHDQVTWKSRHFGVSLSMSSKITHYMAPYYFTDEMQQGPFQRFKHQHVFQTQNDGSTLMTDIIEYEFPLGRLGKWINNLIAGPYLAKLILKRNEVIKGVAEGEEWKRFIF